MTSKPSNMPGLTALRGIAAILVMAHNYTLSFFPDIQKLSTTLFLRKSYLWVDMFFLLSGFVLTHVYQAKFKEKVEYQRYKTFTLARIARIYPLHIATLVVLIVLEFICHYLGGESPVRALSKIPENLAMVHALDPYTYWNEPSWSISAEWLTYIFVPFMILLVSRTTTPSRITVAIICIALLYAIELHYGDFGIMHAGWSLYARCVLEVIIGIILYQFYLQHRSNQGWVKQLIIGIVLLIFVTLCVHLPHTFTVILFALLIYLVAHIGSNERYWLNHPILVWLGTISYSIYLVHDPLKQILVAFAIWFGNPINTETISYNAQVSIVVFCMIASVIIAHVSYKYLEEPCRKFIRKLHG